MYRQTATRQIERMVLAIEQGEVPARIRELYVAGSYARGSVYPNDLNLIVTYDTPAHLERLVEAFDRAEERDTASGSWYPRQRPDKDYESMIRRLLRRPGEKIQFTFGRSMDVIARRFGPGQANTFRILVWSERDRDWRAKLASIREEPLRHANRLRDVELANALDQADFWRSEYHRLLEASTPATLAAVHRVQESAAKEAPVHRNEAAREAGTLACVAGASE